jgi:hypothetical protein
LVATASRRQLHCREAVWGRSPRRTAAPNVSEPLYKPDRPGQRVFERDAQNPTEAGVVVGAGAAGHPVFLPREVCMGPPCGGRPEGGDDDGTTPMQKSDLSVVANRTNADGIRRGKPAKAGGAKGEMD